MREQPDVLRALLRALKRHPLSAAVVLSTAWLVYRRLSYSPIDDPYGAGFLGDFVAINFQVIGFSAAHLLGLDVGSWATILVAGIVMLCAAIGIEWAVPRMMRHRG